VRRTNDTIGDRIITDVPSCIAHAVLKLAEMSVIGARTPLVVEHGLTRTELSPLAGVFREAASASLEWAHAGHERASGLMADLQRVPLQY
jgi:hypothetical protein